MSISGPPPSQPDPIGPNTPTGPGAVKKRPGCLTALYVLFGIGAILLVVGGIATWIFLQTETGEKWMAAAREGAQWAVEASQAPGTQDLRDAGCEVAMVTRLDDMIGFMSQILPEEAVKKLTGTELGSETLVLCQVSLFTGNEGCADYARVYGAAVPDPPARFIMMVREQGGEPVCQAYFTPDGTYLGRADEKDFSLIPKE